MWMMSVSVVVRSRVLFLFYFAGSSCSGMCI